MKAAHLEQRGFSLLEVVLTITVLAVLGAVALGVFSEVRQSTQNATLDSSVAELNKSVNSYVAFGGSVDGARTPAEVFARLKSTASAETADRIAGLSGQFLDPRLNFEFQTTEEAALPVPRAYWDPENQRFNITRRGAPGIKRFFLDDNAIPPQATEHRNPSLKLAAEDPWIWDYQDRIPAEPPAPVFIPTVPVLPGPLPASSEGYVATSTQLAPPLFSRSGGTYPVTDFPLSLSLFNPNPLGTASIYFRIDYASWQSFNGSLISILPNQLLQAQAIPVDPAAYEASVFAEELYDTNLVALALPVIDLSAPQFSLDSPTVTVEITQDDNLENSRIDYRIDGGDWTLYANPFVLNRSDHPEGAVIEAVAVATVPYYLDSSVASASIGTAPPEPVTSLLDADFDTSIAATVPDWSGVSGQLYCNGLDPAQTLLYFDTVDKIAGPATVKSAALYLTRTAGSDGVFYAHGILSGTGDWWVSGITWNTAGDGLQTDGAELDTDAQDSATPVAEIPGVPGWSYRNKWDITDLVQRWIDDPSSNYGVAILAAPEQRIIYCSREHPGENVRPKLVIEWAPR